MSEGKNLLIVAEDELDQVDAYKDIFKWGFEEGELDRLDLSFAPSTNDLGTILDSVSEGVRLIMIVDSSLVGGNGPEFLISYFRDKFLNFGRDFSDNILGLAVFSGYPQGGIPMDELRVSIPGAADRVVYFSKPGDPDKLVAFIREAMARSVKILS